MFDPTNESCLSLARPEEPRFPEALPCVPATPPATSGGLPPHSSSRIHSELRTDAPNNTTSVARWSRVRGRGWSQHRNATLSRNAEVRHTPGSVLAFVSRSSNLGLPATGRRSHTTTSRPRATSPFCVASRAPSLAGKRPSGRRPRLTTTGWFRTRGIQWHDHRVSAKIALGR